MLKKLYYNMVIVFLKLISLLPLKVLYILAAILTPFFSHVISYRKKIIRENLSKSFPEWNQKQIQETMFAFYSYFTRLIVESIKMFSMNLESLEKHIKFKNPEILHDYYSKGQSVIVISAHFGNWEWILGLHNKIPHHSIGVYKPLNDKYFNDLMTNLRTKFKSSIVGMREIPKVLMKLKSEGIPSVSGYIADQSPVWEEIQYWTTFLNQNTPVYMGPEKLARKMAMAVVYFRMKVVSRGMYEVEIVPITDDASKTPEYEVTERHVKLLEDDIKLHPEFWLWSHRRWKLTKRREEEEALGIMRFEGQFKRKEYHA
ncbi:MAG: lysophospholipid acyltransferase family protein [Bacteroidales bacterium]|nr:lysophospholipid acyltransferase family protein [Bacteroidales bacterium]MCF8391925.1 lysophospholipid acyltransferase family protein [Bacteroidales bacterium]